MHAVRLQPAAVDPQADARRQRVFDHGRRDGTQELPGITVRIVLLVRVELDFDPVFQEQVHGDFRVDLKVHPVGVKVEQAVVDQHVLKAAQRFAEIGGHAPGAVKIGLVVEAVQVVDHLAFGQIKVDRPAAVLLDKIRRQRECPAFHHKPYPEGLLGFVRGL